MKKAVVAIFLALALGGCAARPGRSVAKPETGATAPDAAHQESIETSPTAVPLERPSTEPTGISAETEAGALLAYARVLSGDSFLDAWSGVPLRLDPEAGTVTDPYGTESRPLRFLLLDLDADGTRELLLWLQVGEDQNAGFWVLRYYQERVLGYSLTYRSFDKLKQDGTFQVTGSPEDYGIGRMEFSEDGWVFHYAARYKAALDGDGNPAVERFTVDGRSVTQAEFDERYRRHLEKPNAVWLEYTPENLAQAGLGGSTLPGETQPPR